MTKKITFNIENISKSYGQKLVLDNVSLSAKSGQAIGILGTNGSGKSTFLSLVAKNYSKTDYNIGYIPQENPLYDELKPVDNIKLWTRYSKKEILSLLQEPSLAALNIDQFIDVPVSKMSGGMKKRLSIATVLINKPDILLMDEPFSALDLIAKQDILSFMRSYLSTGGIIIVASHDENIFEFCTSVYLLKNGQLTDTTSLTNKGINFIDMLRS